MGSDRNAVAPLPLRRVARVWLAALPSSGRARCLRWSAARAGSLLNALTSLTRWCVAAVLRPEYWWSAGAQSYFGGIVIPWGLVPGSIAASSPCNVPASDPVLVVLARTGMPRNGALRPP